MYTIQPGRQRPGWVLFARVIMAPVKGRGITWEDELNEPGRDLQKDQIIVKEAYLQECVRSCELTFLLQNTKEVLKIFDFYDILFLVKERGILQERTFFCKSEYSDL